MYDRERDCQQVTPLYSQKWVVALQRLSIVLQMKVEEVLAWVSKKGLKLQNINFTCLDQPQQLHSDRQPRCKTLQTGSPHASEYKPISNSSLTWSVLAFSFVASKAIECIQPQTQRFEQGGGRDSQRLHLVQASEAYPAQGDTARGCRKQKALKFLDQLDLDLTNSSPAWSLF